MIYTEYIKVFFDRLMAVVLGIFLSPLIFSICVLLFITQGKSIIFVQNRSGKNMKPFRLYKFRTLKHNDAIDLSMKNRRLTFLGKFLRRSGLDELPQLINILKGEMSFVGPRPMPIAYDDKYNEIQQNRFRVKPGVSGWAQVHGRNDISWEHRFELDVWYVQNIGLLLDLKIIWLTCFQVLISAFNQNMEQREMHVFNGSKLS